MRLAVSHKNAFTQANIGKHSDALRAEHEEPVALLQVYENINWSPHTRQVATLA